MSTADELEEFYVHTIDVQTLTGAGAWGNTYEEHPGIRCFIDETRTIVRDAQGAEVISETNITAPPEFAVIFLPGSLVTLPTREATVIKAGHATSGMLDLPDHVEAWLT